MAMNIPLASAAYVTGLHLPAYRRLQNALGTSEERETELRVWRGRLRADLIPVPVAVEDPDLSPRSGRRAARKVAKDLDGEFTPLTLIPPNPVEVAAKLQMVEMMLEKQEAETNCLRAALMDQVEELRAVVARMYPHLHWRVDRDVAELFCLFGGPGVRTTSSSH